MLRVRHFILLGCLALFSLTSHSANYEYESEAIDACNVNLALHLTLTSPIGNLYEVQTPCSHFANNKTWWFRVQDPVENYRQITANHYYTIAGSAPPTDEVCQARGEQNFVMPYDMTATTPPTYNVVYDGCSYQLNYTFVGDNITDCTVSDNVNVILCNATGSSMLASSAGDTPTTSEQDAQIYEDVLETFADTINSSSASFPTVQTDTPGPGDTTTTSTSTDNTEYSSQQKVTNDNNVVHQESTTGGNETVTTETETINMSDGSSVVKTTTTSTKDDTTTTTTTLDFEDGSRSESVTTYGGYTGSIVNTETTAPDGSTTTTETSTGDSPLDNGREQDEIDGTCLDDGTCNSDIDVSEKLDALQTAADGALATMTGDDIKEDDFLQNYFEMPSGSCSNPSIDGVTIDLCTKTQDLRDGLGWMFYMLTVIFIYSVATRGNN